MAKTFTASIVTANDLIEGYATFLGPEGWSRDIAQAMVALSAEQAEEFLALAARHVRANHVVEPYLVEVDLIDGLPVPQSRREQIRASGAPTIAYGRAA